MLSSSVSKCLCPSGRPLSSGVTTAQRTAGWESSGHWCHYSHGLFMISLSEMKYAKPRNILAHAILKIPIGHWSLPTALRLAECAESALCIKVRPPVLVVLSPLSIPHDVRRPSCLWYCHFPLKGLSSTMPIDCQSKVYLYIGIQDPRNKASPPFNLFPGPPLPELHQHYPYMSLLLCLASLMHFLLPRTSFLPLHLLIKKKTLFIIQNFKPRWKWREGDSEPHVPINQLHWLSTHGQPGFFLPHPLLLLKQMVFKQIPDITYFIKSVNILEWISRSW